MKRDKLAVLTKNTIYSGPIPDSLFKFPECYVCMYVCLKLYEVSLVKTK